MDAVLFKLQMQWTQTSVLCAMTARAAGAKGVKPEDFMPEVFREKRAKRTLTLAELHAELHKN